MRSRWSFFPLSPSTLPRLPRRLRESAGFRTSFFHNILLLCIGFLFCTAAKIRSFLSRTALFAAAPLWAVPARRSPVSILLPVSDTAAGRIFPHLCFVLPPWPAIPFLCILLSLSFSYGSRLSFFTSVWPYFSFAGFSVGIMSYSLDLYGVPAVSAHSPFLLFQNPRAFFLPAPYLQTLCSRSMPAWTAVPGNSFSHRCSD